MAGMTAPQPGAVPVPDPTVRTVEQLQREIAASREVVESGMRGGFENVATRLAGMDKAIDLLQVSSGKLPGFIKDEVGNLRELHDEKFKSVESRSKIQFDGIATQFAERDKRTEQLSLADKTAIAAALQAQKEAAGATNESSSIAITKMELNFAKLIEQNNTLLQTISRSLDEKIGDLRGRIDRGEGKTSVSDPAIADAIKQIAGIVQGLTVSRDTSAGKSQGSQQVWGFVGAGIGIAVGALVSIILALLRHA